MQSLSDILKAEDFATAATTFGISAINDIQARLTDKKGTTYVKCLVRDKEVLAKPEELIRQFWIHRLMNQYGYPKSRMTVELSR
ncbi:hypothetical protein GCM10017783_25900 [Deinococcus piscis]|uniref:Type I restriction enzyme R protein N-terminal domain-containing protein n=1 Tax=Deinococcus piscis TaxID=394230 RepID=A0ABQ3KC87_9DEIO|nr:type I restriction enzyme HsdR N-terminal domain-containing protein [Deinococcus piscis]GHG12723.1 hypothetical protein GCM10017783_25900 [Deinococcus piscis]